MDLYIVTCVGTEENRDGGGNGCRGRGSGLAPVMTGLPARSVPGLGASGAAQTN